MQEVKKFEVKWRLINQSTFMYGTKLLFDNDDVYFENPLMPSGTVIHNWYMLTNFNEHRVSPKLPILKKGHRYLFKFNFQVDPEGSIYYKLKFYLKNGDQFDYQLIKTKEAEVTYPKKAHSYQLEMINAGMNHIKFHKITIEEIGDGVYQTSSHDVKNKHQQKLNTINKVIQQVRSYDSHKSSTDGGESSE